MRFRALGRLGRLGKLRYLGFLSGLGKLGEPSPNRPKDGSNFFVFFQSSEGRFKFFLYFLMISSARRRASGGIFYLRPLRPLGNFGFFA